MDEFEKMLQDDRDEAIRWARNLLTQPFVVLDTETTGLDSDDCIVQIGIVDQDGKVLLDSYVKPHKPIPKQASDLHGITDEHCQDAPAILELEQKIKDTLMGRLLVIYNADYDLSMLYRSFLYSPGWPKPEGHWTWGYCYNLAGVAYCAMNKFAAYYGQWNDYKGSYKWQRLTFAASCFGIDTDGAHGAVKDALMTLGVVKGMAAAQLSSEVTPVEGDSLKGLEHFPG